MGDIEIQWVIIWKHWRFTKSRQKNLNIHHLEDGNVTGWFSLFFSFFLNSFYLNVGHSLWKWRGKNLWKLRALRSHRNVFGGYHNKWEGKRKDKKERFMFQKPQILHLSSVWISGWPLNDACTWQTLNSPGKTKS